MKKRYIAPIIRKVDIESDPLMEVVSMPVIDNGSDNKDDEVGGGDVLAPQGSIWEE